MGTADEVPDIRVLVVEDDTSLADALCSIVQASAGMRLAGRAGSVAEGLALLQRGPADVLLVDLGLPDGSGIVVIEAATRQWPACSVMVSTHFGDEAHVMRSLEAGAVGYLLKDSAPAKVVDEIRNLANGGSPISPIIARKILKRFREAAQGPAAQSPAAESPPQIVSPLSAREQQVLGFITKGFTTQEIAQLMALSHFTVRSFVRRIYAKLQVKSKSEAIYEARTLGLLGD